MSEQFKIMDKILPALAAAIADMPDPKKNSMNPAFKNRFADLGEVLDCAREPLQRHGLLVMQTVEAENGIAILNTTIWHIASQQSIASRLPLIMEKNTSQAQGSALSYGRRYSLKTMLSMVDTDDDGNAASGRRAPERSQAESGAAKKASHASSKAPVVLPFDFVEEAVAEIGACETWEELRGPAVGQRLAANKESRPFTGEDKVRAESAWKAAVERLKPKEATK